MATSHEQRQAMIDCFLTLDVYFRNRKDVFVSIDLMVYYEEGNNKARVAPNVFVVRGVPKESRDNYKVWEEGKVTDLAAEFASPRTPKCELRVKTELYRRLGVGEYWMFDPQGGLHEPRLQGNALCCGRYVLIKPAPRPGVPLAFYSPVLDLELHFDSDRLRFCEPEAAGYLRTAKEAYERLRAEAAA